MSTSPQIAHAPIRPNINRPKTIATRVQFSHTPTRIDKVRGQHCVALPPSFLHEQRNDHKQVRTLRKNLRGSRWYNSWSEGSLDSSLWSSVLPLSPLFLAILLQAIPFKLCSASTITFKSIHTCDMPMG